MANIRNLKIGYIPYSSDLSQPGDRRRFPYFANRHNLQFEIAELHKEYDVILITALSNLSKWLKYKKNHPHTRFIFEMVDSLILTSDPIRTFFKGPGRFFIKKEKHFYFHYKTPIKEWIKNADIVICSNPEIKKKIFDWNKNIFVNLDYLQGEIKILKTDYSTNGKLKLVWEGLGVALPYLLKFKDLFSKINSFCELHIITDETFPKFGNLFQTKASDIIKQLPIDTFFHKWEIYKNYQDLEKFDCCIIPLDKKNKFGWYKPGNKLISFWFCGMPTLTSDTPAYKLIMDKACTDWYCNSEEEWIKKVLSVKNMTIDERKIISERNLAFVKKYFSDEALDKVWIEIFEKTTTL